MTSSSKSFIASFWDGINDLSPQKKRPRLSPQDPALATAAFPPNEIVLPALRTDKSALDATEQENPTPKTQREDEKEEQTPKSTQDAASPSTGKGSLAAHLHGTQNRRSVSQVASSPIPDRPTRPRHATPGVFSTTSSVTKLSTLIPQPSASQPTRKSQYTTYRKRNRLRAAPSSSAPAPLGRSTPAAPRIKTPRALIPETHQDSQPSSDPYDLDSIILEDEQKQPQEEELGDDHPQTQDTRARPKGRTTTTSRSSVKKVTASQMDTQTYEIERILDFRPLRDGESELAHTGGIELLVYWSGYDDDADHTWEDEDELQLTARDVVLDFWKSHPAGGRDAALGLDASDGNTPYRALRVVGGPKMYRKRTKTTSKGQSSKANTHKGENSSKHKSMSTTGVEEEEGNATAELYRVEWVGYAEKTWEPRENLPEDMIQAYLVDQEARNSRKRKRTAD